MMRVRVGCSSSLNSEIVALLINAYLHLPQICFQLIRVMHVVRVKCALLFNQQQLFYIMQVVRTVIVCPCVGLKWASAYPCFYYRYKILIHEMRG